jgi:hypothetical protein
VFESNRIVKPRDAEIRGGFAMKRVLAAVMIVAAAGFLVTGCAKQADPNKPMDQIQKEVETMSVGDLQAYAKAYVIAVDKKKAELVRVGEKLKAVPLKDLFSEGANELRKQSGAISKEISDLTQRYGIYAKKYAEKGGDLAKIKLS